MTHDAMPEDDLRHLETAYGLACVAQRPGPRQFVATTWIVTTADGAERFCKFVRKPRFAARVRRSISALAALCEAGCACAVPPLPTLDGAWTREVEGGVLYVQPYVPAPQSYAYDAAALGRAFAQVHSIGAGVARHRAPAQRFDDAVAVALLERLEALLGETSSDAALRIAREAARHDKGRYARLAGALAQAARRCQEASLERVFTHGDAPGNVLVEGPETLHIIDWDDVRWAPPARDVWMVAHLPGLMDAYRAARPEATLDEVSLDFAALDYLFDAAGAYLDSIVSAAPLEVRVEHAEGLAGLLEGWMRPHVQRVLMQAP